MLGDFTITAVSDGYLHGDLKLLGNIDTTEAVGIQEKAGITDHTSIHINCFLVRGGGRTVLIDAGAGGIKDWGGRLNDNLLLARVQPTDVDAILLTHAHPDHVGGLVDASGNPIFPNAELIAHELEIAFWQDDGNLSRSPERARGNFLAARRAFDGYRNRLSTFNTGDVLNGITAVTLPGHTPGHTGYRIESNGQNLLVWGDIVHFPAIQISHPDVSIAFDQDANVAIQTRKRLLDMVSSEQLLIAGMHFSELGFARIKRTSGTYAVKYEAVSEVLS